MDERARYATGSLTVSLQEKIEELSMFVKRRIAWVSTAQQKL
jgi:hypothetical protein